LGRLCRPAPAAVWWRKSWYFFFFATPGLPEEIVQARDWHFFRHFLQDANPSYTPEEIERYVEAWSQPGAAAGMINYYRASVRQSQNNLDRVERLAGASHWVHHDEAERVNQLLSDFFAPAK
jgi:epoxide hydrolase 4